ncbi:MAG TPA: endonuclease/exonuclease/phosphatase family protein [Burkholderiales bacterium]|jgi:endonuclease/exonuclease/phosphatase family metal-dependent hydrolase|nr:endonuclease/exonuclease/phosphatase family protein [Burkholderiales bacterium]
MRLMTWNVQWCRGVDGRVDPARIAAEVKRIADPDVVCMQEVAQNFPELAGSAGEDGAEELSRNLRDYETAAVWSVDRPAAGGGRSRFGNLILSRLKLGRVLRHSLPWPAAPDVPSMPRAAVEAVVEAPFGPLRVITTHLEYYSGAHRAAQIERLAEIHAEACAPRKEVRKPGTFTSDPRPSSAILCGDFNLPAGDPLRERVKQAGFVDAWEALHPGVPHPPTFCVHEHAHGDAPYCCDFVFVTADLVPRLKAVRIDGATQASDHQPVIVELS